MRQELILIFLITAGSVVAASEVPQIADPRNDVLLDAHAPQVGISDPAVDILTVAFHGEAGDLLVRIHVQDIEHRPPTWETYYYDVTFRTDTHESVHVNANDRSGAGWSADVACWNGDELACLEELDPPTVDGASSTLTLRIPTSIIGRGAFEPSAIASARYSRLADLRPNAGIQDRAPDQGTGSDYHPTTF